MEQPECGAHHCRHLRGGPDWPGAGARLDDAGASLPVQLICAGRGKMDNRYVHLEQVGMAFDTKKGRFVALQNVNLDIAQGEFISLIGHSGCGKSTFIRCLNRMHELTPNTKVTGTVLLDGENIYDSAVDPVSIRRRVGMVFQKPNPFPKSIYENVAYGLRLQGINKKSVLDDVVEHSLKGAALWDEVKDRLHDSALGLSGGQQQRLVIARAIAIEPEVLLLDEPASALDPISTLKIEELIHELRDRFTILIVTHNMQQAARVSDYTAFMYLGKLIEHGDTDTLFTNPTNKQTEDYITGRYG